MAQSTIDPDSLLPRLLAEFGYPEEGARLVATDLCNSTPQVQSAFLRWWTTGEVPRLSVAGYSTQDLIEQHGMNPIAAFLTLDWLAREPEKARTALRRGHDRVRLQGPNDK